MLFDVHEVHRITGSILFFLRIMYVLKSKDNYLGVDAWKSVSRMLLHEINRVGQQVDPDRFLSSQGAGKDLRSFNAGTYEVRIYQSNSCLVINSITLFTSPHRLFAHVK